MQYVKNTWMVQYLPYMLYPIMHWAATLATIGFETSILYIVIAMQIK